MRNFLHVVLFSALLLCGLNLNAQKTSTPEVKVDRGEDFTLVKILDTYAFPYDVSNNKQHVVIQNFGPGSGYYWSEKTGVVTVAGYPYAVSDDGIVAGCYENNVGMNVAGLWSAETKEWEFLGMNPDQPEFSTVQGDTEYNGAWSMSNDGKTVGVMQIFPDWTSSAYIWTKDNGYTKLQNGISPQTRPNAISDDGRVIAGFAAHETKGEWTPCYWIDSELYRFPHLFGEALNVSHNGNYICGTLFNDNAFIYDISDDKLVQINNTLEPDFGLSATCVTDNGIVFGHSDGGSPSDRNAIVYIGGDLLYFKDYLTKIGIEEADTWTIYGISNVTKDGKTFVGSGVIDGAECTFLLTLEGTPCNAPTNLTYHIENTNNIILNWQAPKNAENVTYDIYLNYTGAPFAEGLTETTFTFDNMEAGEYQFFVRAKYDDGCLSDISNMVRPTVSPCATNERCELTIVATDQYADGWDFAYISVKGSLSDLEYKVELTDGGDINNPETITLKLCPDTYQFTWVPANWDEEVGFAIYFQDEELYRVNFGDIDATFKEEPMFFEYEINCEADPLTYNVTATVNLEDAGTITGNIGTYGVYETIRLFASANEGYKFINWTEDGEIVSTNEKYHFEITNDRNLVANFVSTESIDELSSSFSIYPNPVNNKLFIETEVEIKEVAIYTITGVMVGQQTTDNRQQTLSIDVTNLNSGIYFIKINTRNGEMTKRFIKK